MLDGITLTELLWKVASPIISAAARGGFAALVRTPPVRRAIAATQADCGDLPITRLTVTFALEAWIGSADFERTVKRLRAGDRDIVDVDLVDGFIQQTQLEAAGDSRAAAHQILTTFAKHLEYELLKTDEGLPTLAARTEVLTSAVLDRQARAADILSRVDESTQQLLDLQRQSLREIQMQRAPASDLAPRIPPDDSGRARETSDLKVHAKIDAARSLLIRGRARSARQLLEAVRAEIGDTSPSVDIAFRLATNLGACALQLGDTTFAVRQFDVALALRPGHPTALTNAATAALLRDELEEARRLSTEARGLAPNDPQARAVYIQALDRLGHTDEIQDLLAAEPWIAADGTCALVLGELWNRRGRYAESMPFLRRAVQEQPEDPDAHALLAQALFNPVQESIASNPPLPWRLSAAQRDPAERAEEALSRAVVLLEDHESPSRLSDALTNRAAVRLLLGRAEEAAADCDRALLLDASQRRASKLKASALLETGKAEEALATLQRIPQGQDDPDIAALVAQTLRRVGRPADAATLLRRLWRPDLHDAEQLVISEILAVALAEDGDMPAAEEVLRSISRTWPADPEALAAAARCRRAQRRPDEAIELLREALGYSSGPQSERIALDLGLLYYEQQRYPEAAETLGRIADTQRDNPILRKYLISLLNSGSLREAFLIAKSIRGDTGPIPVVSEVEARILEYIGDIREARKLTAALAALEPDRIEHRLRLVKLDIRMGDRDSARTLVTSIRRQDIEQNARALMEVAQARRLLGLDGALALAYLARRIGFNDPQIHLQYAGLFLAHEKSDEAVLSVDHVVPDCTVHLRRGAEKRHFTLLAEGTPQLERCELALDDPLAKRLLGLRKGGRVSLRSEPFEEPPYEVVDVQSKYVFAFQETFSTFTTWFPENKGLHRLEIAEGDVSKILAAVDARARQVEAAVKLHRTGQFPLGAVAKATHSSLIDTWMGLISMPEARLVASGGIAEELAKERELLATARTIVVDLTALLGIHYLNLLPLLPKLVERLLVPQAVIDALTEAIVEDDMLPPPAGTLARIGDRYVHEEISPEAWTRRRTVPETILQFISSSAQVVPVSAALTLGKARLEEFEQVLGKASAAAALVASEHGAPLYADDLALRRVAQAEWGVDGLWTQTVLQAMRDRGLLEAKGYRDAIRKLVGGNYHFLSVDAETLLGMLLDGEMNVDRKTARVFDLLQGPECDEDRAVVILASLIRTVWLEQALYHQKLAVLDLVLTVLTTGRLVSRVLRKLRAALRPRLALLPLAEHTIFRSIELWEQQRALSRGLIS
ncbi:MAG TPA: tetratricopeptide repeat protein [Thermodesulfobacteriota bacterium]